MKMSVALEYIHSFKAGKIVIFFKNWLCRITNEEVVTVDVKVLNVKYSEFWPTAMMNNYLDRL